jgi:Double zinc ribbon
MYCPKCAHPNSDDTKFCRACGENLTAIAQVMSKHLPVTLVSKLDAHIERKENRLRRDGIMTGLTGIFLLLSGIGQVAAHTGSWLSTVLMFVGALVLLLMSGWDLLAYQRSKSRQAGNVQLPRTAETGKLEAGNVRQIPLSSIAEQTTRHLDSVVGGSGNLN